MKKFLSKLNKSEKGATVIEYALIAALIAIAAIAALRNVGQGVDATLTKVSEALPAAGGGGSSGGDEGGGDE